MIDRDATSPAQRPGDGRSEQDGRDPADAVSAVIAQAAELVPAPGTDPIVVLEVDAGTGRLRAESGAATARGDQRLVVPAYAPIHRVWQAAARAMVAILPAAITRVVIDIGGGAIAAWSVAGGHRTPDVIAVGPCPSSTFQVPARIDVVHALPPARDHSAWARIVYLSARYGVAGMGGR